MKTALEVTDFCKIVSDRPPETALKIVQYRSLDRMLWEHRRFCASLGEKAYFVEVLLSMLSFKVFDRSALPNIFDHKAMQLIHCPFLTNKDVPDLRKILKMEAFTAEQVLAHYKGNCDSYIFVPVRNEYVTILIEEHSILNKLDQFFQNCRNSIINARINASVIGTYVLCKI